MRYPEESSRVFGACNEKVEGWYLLLLSSGKTGEALLRTGSVFSSTDLGLCVRACLGARPDGDLRVVEDGC